MPSASGGEEDVEVGLQYFGFRFLNPLLGRWISPDPLEVHSVGETGEFNVYAYVSGTVLKSTDPLGLCDGCEGQGNAGAGDGNQADSGSDPGAKTQENGPQQSAAQNADQARNEAAAEKEQKARGDAWFAGSESGAGVYHDHKGDSDAASKIEAAKAKALADCGAACKGNGADFAAGFDSAVNRDKTLDRMVQDMATLGSLGRGTPGPSLGSSRVKPPARSEPKLAPGTSTPGGTPPTANPGVPRPNAATGGPLCQRSCRVS